MAKVSQPQMHGMMLNQTSQRYLPVEQEYIDMELSTP